MDCPLIEVPNYFQAAVNPHINDHGRTNFCTRMARVLACLAEMIQ
jgi:hypothetical protein